MWFTRNKQNMLGVQFTDNKISLVVLRKEQGKFLVIARHVSDIQPGIIKDGLIYEKELLASRLQDSLAKLDLPTTRGMSIVVVLPARQSYTHIFDLPGNLDISQIEGALALEAENVMPISLADTYSDFREIVSIVDTDCGRNSKDADDSDAKNDTANGDKKAAKKDKHSKQVSKKYLFAAVARGLVDDYLEVMHMAELKPIAFDLEALSQGRALLIEDDDTCASLVVNIDEKHTTISSFSGYELYASSVILLGRADFVDVAAGIWQLNSSEASKRLSQVGHESTRDNRIKDDKNYAHNSHQDGKKAQEAFGDLIERLSKEIKRVCKYHSEQVNGEKIGRIMLCGSGGFLPGMLVSLSEKTELPIQSCCPSWARNGFTGDDEECSVYATVLGAARLGLEAKENVSYGINLLPVRYKHSLHQDDVRVLVSILQLITGVFLTTFLTVFIVVWATLDIEAGSLHDINEITAKILKGERYDEISELINDFNKEVRIATQTDPDDKITSKIFDDIIKTLPGGVNIKNLNWLGDNAIIEIHGSADTRDNYLAFRDALIKKPYVGEIEVPLSNLTKREEVDFTLIFPLLTNDYE